MATINRFEELECWQAGRVLKREVYRLSRNRDFARDLPLVSQIRRAASSVTANIVEGFERSGNREFIQFLATSKGSCGEVKDHLYTAIDENYITQTDFDRCYQLCEDASRLVGGFMRYLDQTEMKGAKFASSTRKTPTRNSEPGTRNPHHA